MMMGNAIARSTRTANTLGRIALTLGACVHANDDSQMAAEQMNPNESKATFGN